jgi:general secretion pathway protein D
MHTTTFRTYILLFIIGTIVIGSTGTLYSQIQEERRAFREFTPPDAIVSMEKSLTFDRAITALNEVSKKFTGKIIIDTEQRTDEIGVHIESMHWRDAFDTILRQHGLFSEERGDHFLIRSRPEVVAPEVARERERALDPDRPTLRTREINISAVFFEINHTKMRESGIRWNFFRSDPDFGDIGADFGTRRPAELGIIDRGDRALSVDVTPDISFGNLNALIQLFEGTEIGEVIASPEVTVRSGQTGRIQVGEDISIKQRDFAGNIIDQFIETGTIIEVTPEIIVEDGIPFISLDILAERSSGTPGAISTIVAKAEAQTRVLLLDGEETVIGGLYLTEERVVREGIPVLKDLPWWFFGLKYLFGYNRVERDKQELVILLKARIVPTLEERLAADRERNLIQERRRQYQQDLEFRREAGDIR